MPYSRSEAFGATFDYIVIGGGTSGPVVARRLADAKPECQILLLEAGPTHEDIVNSHMAMGWQEIIHTEHDWNYDTVPQPGANNRKIHIPRAKFLGGCSGINGTLIVRGPKDDYNRWAAAGNKGWGWDDLLPYFKKFETFHPGGDVPASDLHGTSGPIMTSVHPLAPISQRILESFVSTGTAKYKPDMFVQGEGEGIGHATRTLYKGVRTTGADYVWPNKNSNLTVLANAFVRRVILSSEGGTARAIGVEVEDTSEQSTTPKVHIVKATKEITLSAGTYNSPQILMHSGIGPKEQLSEVGIECKVDSAYVGSNLQDHLIVFTFYKVNDPSLTYDSLVYPPGTLTTAFTEWSERKTGVLSRFPFGSFTYKRMNELMLGNPAWEEAKRTTGLDDPTGQTANQPHIEYFNSELYGGGPQFKDLPSLPSHGAFCQITMLCGPQARGTVRLSSTDPHAHPVVDHKYFSNDLDLAILTEGTRLVNKVLLEGDGTRGVITDAWPETLKHPGKDNYEGWKEWVKNNAYTCFHPGGTCKMGRPHDGGVVDDRLRVYGVEGLRVVDCSIMPWINNGHTQAPAYMIGEKGAAMILEDS